MNTPADIENKIFGKAVRGYKEEEVDEFLNEIIYDMEQLIRENNQLKAKLEKAKEQVGKQVSTERSVYETLEAAKGLMNDIAASAERRAEVLLKDAQLEANLIKKEAKESVIRLTEESESLQRRVNSLRSRYREMLEAELTRLDSPRNDLLAEFEKDFLPETPAAVENTAEMRRDFTVENVKINGAVENKATVVMSPDDILAAEKKAAKDEKVDLSKTVVNIRY